MHAYFYRVNKGLGFKLYPYFTISFYWYKWYIKPPIWEVDQDYTGKYHMLTIGRFQMRIVT